VAATTTIAQPLQAPRLSIVVLPFANLGNDPDQQYFSDGITEDLTTDLSRIAGMFVISRNTAFTYQGRRIDTKQISRELGVRYVLEGSVQRSGDHVRISAQLIDAVMDGHLWAERFDAEAADLFALQNEITRRIANTLGIELIAAEVAQPSEHPDALDYILRGRAAIFKPASRDSRSQAITMFERALALDPQSAEAQSRLASTLAIRVLEGSSNSAAVDIARAEQLVGQALATSPNSPLAHLAKGDVLRAQAQVLGRQNQWDMATLESEMVLASDRNSVVALRSLANCKFFTGSIEEAVPLAEQSIRLSPRDPQIWFPYSQIGRTRLLQSRIDEAILWLEKARSANPANPGVRALLASAYGLKGETERGAAELAEARKLRGGGAYSSISSMRAGPYGVPKLRGLSEPLSLPGCG
jgi:TolB-like protein/Flp pilus assembly protein TadD